MTLELLPNEILIQCLEYLNAFDLFHSFDHLNYRFNELIRSIKLDLNFQDFNKSIFDEICTRMLQNPHMKSQVYSLQLSNKYGCPQIQTFLTLFSLDEFSNLQSLTIVEIDDLPTAEKLKSMLPLLPPLYYLHLSGPKFDRTVELADLPLSKLRILSISELDSFILSTHETSSIINLTISMCLLYMLYEIIEYVPMLKYLNIGYLSHAELKYTDAHVSDRCALHLKQLIINDAKCKFKHLKIFVTRTPNLKSLTIDGSNNIAMANAHRWEHLISSSLLHLAIFKFKFGCYDYLCDVDRMIEKLKQFQTDFWQEQHHWYTEYEKKKRSAFIYTIPYMSDTFDVTFNKIRYSNHLINNVNTFDNVTNLELTHDALMENCQYYFSNITSLTLTPGYHLTTCHLKTKHIEYLKMIVNLFNLKHLCISDNDHGIESSSVLLEILKETPQLSSLTIDPCLLVLFLNDGELCKYLNKMIERLHITGYIYEYSSQENFFYETFSNIKHLQCQTSSSDHLLLLLSHLPKLFTLKAELIRPSDPKSELFEFKKKAQELNAIVHYDPVPCNHRYKIFMWVGKQKI